MTLVFDPTGSAHDFLKVCIESIRMQESRDFTWLVSIQDGTHPSILKLIEDAHGFEKTIYRSDAKSLGEHLQQAMSRTLGSTWIHLLCQDDYYTSPNAVQVINRTLSSSNACILVPSSNNSDFIESSKSSGRLGAWKIRVAQAGVNRIGGLSSLAWRTRDLSIDSEFSLMADLALLRQLISAEANPPLVRHALGEHRWPGQAQFNLVDKSAHEFTAWMEQGKKLPFSAALSSGIAECYGYRELAQNWSRYSKTSFLVLRFVGRFAGKLRHEYLRLMSNGRMV